MPAKKWLIGAFFISLVVFVVVTLPASFVLGRLNGLQLGSGRLSIESVGGSIWHGQTHWRWSSLSGDLLWQLKWQGLSPGVEVAVSGPLTLSGWVGGWSNALSLRDANLHLSGTFVSSLQPQLKFAGDIYAKNVSLKFRDKALTDAAGQFTYTGGLGSWAGQKQVMVPALNGELIQKDDGPSLLVKSESGTALGLLGVSENIGSIAVYRAWAGELGLSRGGDDADVIFETSLPLWQKP
ncbi:MAG: type II secretion system protein N [Alcanivoracaceae bacterium]|nr:type II secretion system protein N [Alcanivoracaceae bacterium]